MIQREIRAVGRILQQEVTPSFFHIPSFSLKPRQFRGCIFISTSRKLMVIQFDKGRPDIAITCLADTKAEIDIVECDLEVDLIQTSTFLINFLAYDHARCGHRRETLSELARLQ